MTKIVKVSLAVLIGSSMSVATASEMKLYDLKSGKVEYEIKGSGSIMGQKMESIGKKRVIFDDNGAKNLTEENKIDKQIIMGQKNITKTHTMTYMKNGMVYHVNFDNRRIMRMENMAASMGALMGGGQNMKQSGEAMMTKMGGKKTGTDTVLGYTCDVWNLMGTKQCMYKGIPLRVESNIMGIKTTELATKAEFDLSLSSDDFMLPDFPIYDEHGTKLDKNSLSKRDQKVNVSSSKSMQDNQDMQAAMMAAMTAAGSSQGGDQEAQMKAAMMSAMGGEKAMLAQTKQEIFAEAENLPAIRKCFQNANSVNAANRCEQMADSEDPEYHTQWNDQTKSDLLNEIDMFEKAIPCLKRASTFSELETCMPQ
ncbi:hypothetical protein [Sulfurovum sp.]|uniref:hypothetical protein n=1 Tax=Sulfurovum sp. TaxID=1969726 RepID=UPI002867C97F|nr:hypothetical protein [Sulfurovum sp.]